MIIIPDANSIISALIKRGKVFDLFKWNDFNREIKFVAPEHLSIEVRNHIPLIIEKSGLSESEIIELLNKIESQIEFVPKSKFDKFLTSAVDFSPPKDFPYTALALFLKSNGKTPRILSNDKKFLESLSTSQVRGLTMHDLLRELNLS